MLKTAPANAFNLQGDGKGKKIIILGAGLAGMSAAYELEKLGYNCTIIEARERAGGRCFSVRNGSTNQEVNQTKQTAVFDDGLYFNAGPSRIAHHHEITLHYCKELGVPLETYNNVNDAAYYFAEGKGKLSNKKIRIREIQNDVRGYTSELMAKAMDTTQLNALLTKEDTQKIIEYLRAEGGLDIDKLYKASSRRGYTQQPAEDNKDGVIAEAYQLQDIIASGLLDPDFYNVSYYTYELQMTMFQAVGGMDKIATALQQKLKKPILFGAEVTDIKNESNGVVITYKSKNGVQKLAGDICICTIPLPVLSNINHNFSSDVSRAIDYVQYINTCKIGLQFKRRFWEEDESVYGGITHTNNELTQIFYPNNNFLGKKGILLGFYNFNDKAKRVGVLSFKDRETLALQKGSLIHPQYSKEFEKSFSISWQHTKHSLGGWAVYNDSERKSVYQALLKPDGNVYFAGEHLTYWNAWMAGAFLSARSVVASIHARVNEQRIAYQAPV
ncbi:MAG: flavin monoamine oxidase family protein [Deinococcales bacterium]|nr:flavin monoamine oxidase family protein [Chitinophagaceae bacterium]